MAHHRPHKIAKMWQLTGVYPLLSQQKELCGNLPQRRYTNKGIPLYACAASPCAQVKVVVQESDPVPRFAKTGYTGLINENAKPPVFIIDLRTSDEQNGRAVKYEIISGNKGETTPPPPTAPALLQHYCAGQPPMCADFSYTSPPSSHQRC